MNEETKIFMKQSVVLLLCGVIGGIIGGIVVKCCHPCCHYIRHAHFHHGQIPPAGNFEKNRKSGFKEIVTEENYIIVPREIIDYLRKNDKMPEPFSGPRP